MTEPVTGRAGPIAYELRGRADAGLPLLLIRPLGGSMDLWGSFRDILAEERSIISFDPRGTGASRADPGWISTPGLAEDARDLLDHLRVPRADVFGLSLGGMTATWLAIVAPERVASLCLASTPARGIEVTRAGIGRELRLAACFAHPLVDIESSLVRRILSSRFRTTHPEEVHRIERMLQAHPATRRSLLRHALAGLLHDARSRLGDVRSSTLVLAGELDALLGTKPSRELADGIAGARFEVVVASGHDLTLEQPEVTARTLLDFLAATSPRGEERVGRA